MRNEEHAMASCTMSLCHKKAAYKLRCAIASEGVIADDDEEEEDNDDEVEDEGDLFTPLLSWLMETFL